MHKKEKQWDLVLLLLSSRCCWYVLITIFKACVFVVSSSALITSNYPLKRPFVGFLTPFITSRVPPCRRNPYRKWFGFLIALIGDAVVEIRQHTQIAIQSARPKRTISAMTTAMVAQYSTFHQHLQAVGTREKTWNLLVGKKNRESFFSWDIFGNIISEIEIRHGNLFALPFPQGHLLSRKFSGLLKGSATGYPEKGQAISLEFPNGSLNRWDR